MTPVGRILIIPRDGYIGNTLYEPLDLVTHNGSAWLCKKTAQNIEPSTANVEFWMKLFDLEIVNNLTYSGEKGALDARQGGVLKKMIDEKVVYESIELLSGEDGKITIPTKDGYTVFSAFCQNDGYTIIGNASALYLYSINNGRIGEIFPNKFCKVAVTYAKKV